MTSNDINTLDMSTLELLLREHFAHTDKQLSDMRADNAEFRTQIIKDFSEFTEIMNKKLNDIHSETQHINEKMTGVEHDITGLYHWNYWIISIVLFIFALPHLSEAITSFAKAIEKSISWIIFSLRKKKSLTNDK